MYDSEREHSYETAEKHAVEPLREVLNRAVISLNKEIEMLATRIAPVLRMSEPSMGPQDVGPPVPHTSEVAGHVYELHRLANVVAQITHRVEL